MNEGVGVFGPVGGFLADKPEVLEKLRKQAKAPLKNIVAVNSTRYSLLERLRATGLAVETASGGLTKFNRSERQIPKTQWLDAACVGTSTPEVLHWQHVRPFAIKAIGHGKRQVVGTDKYGFPRGQPKCKPTHPYKTGDFLSAEVPKGIHAGVYSPRRIVSLTDETRVRIRKSTGKVFPFQAKYINNKIFSADGYDYGFTEPVEYR